MIMMIVFLVVAVPNPFTSLTIDSFTPNTDPAPTCRVADRARKHPTVYCSYYINGKPVEDKEEEAKVQKAVDDALATLRKTEYPNPGKNKN